MERNNGAAGPPDRSSVGQGTGGVKRGTERRKGDVSDRKGANVELYRFSVIQFVNGQ